MKKNTAQTKAFEKKVKYVTEILKRNYRYGLDGDTKENRYSIAHYNQVKPNVMAEACRRYRKFVARESRRDLQSV